MARDVRYGARLGIRRVKNMMVNKISVLTMICATYVDGLGESDLRTEDTCMRHLASPRQSHPSNRRSH